MYSKIILYILSANLLMSCGGNKKSQEVANEPQQEETLSQNEQHEQEPKYNFPITGKWIHYNCELQDAIILDIGADKSFTIREGSFYEIHSQYSGTYTYSDGKGKYKLTNALEDNDVRNNSFSISFTPEGLMKIKFNENFKEFNIATNNTLAFHQEKMPIAFKEKNLTALNFYKAIYPYIFEVGFCESYNFIVSGECSSGAKLTYSSDKKHLCYEAFDDEENYTAKFDLKIWSYPKSEDLLVGINLPYILDNVIRSGLIRFYRYDAKKHLLFPLDEKAIVPHLKKVYIDENFKRDYLLDFPLRSSESVSKDKIELYIHEETEVGEVVAPVKNYYKLKWNGKTFSEE